VAQPLGAQPLCGVTTVVGSNMPGRALSGAEIDPGRLTVLSAESQPGGRSGMIPAGLSHALVMNELPVPYHPPP